VLFLSDRNGPQDIFRQALDQDSAEAIVTGPEEKNGPRLSPDGSWVLYSLTNAGNTGTSAATRVMRIPTPGGPPELVLTARGVSNMVCARLPATFCALDEMGPDQKQRVISAFDPVKGRGRELARIDGDPSVIVNWALSPDGSSIATIKFDRLEGRIRFVSLTGKSTPDLIVKGWSSLNSVDWSSDGKALLVSSNTRNGATLLYIDLKGGAHPLWEQKGVWQTWGIPSPDGRYLALSGRTLDSNAWMIENF
jgi:Tol biopolymer transport system component